MFRGGAAFAVMSDKSGAARDGDDFPTRGPAKIRLPVSIARVACITSWTVALPVGSARRTLFETRHGVSLLVGRTDILAPGMRRMGEGAPSPWSVEGTAGNAMVPRTVFVYEARLLAAGNRWENL